MATTRIKICGITRREDAKVAVNLGADAVGMVFHPGSPRAVTHAQARSIVEVVPPFVSVVALFVNEKASTIRQILGSVPIDVLQFHGEEPVDFCRQFERPWIKAIRVRPGLDLVSASDQYRGARGLLLDTWQEGVPGGTGKIFDWELARGELHLPVVLAGGLHAGNVGDAIGALRPAAVDVSSGVESAPGTKDADRIRQFVMAVRAADERLNG